MAFMSDGWVERLRDGTPAPSWPVHVVALVLVIGAPALIVAEFRSPTFVAETAHSSQVGSIVLVELMLVVVGFAMSIGTWWSGRRDRRILARIHASGHRPAFFLPVLTKSLRASEDLAHPRPEVWTIDEAGLHGWTPDRDAPVFDVPWARIERISLATKDSRGTPGGLRALVRPRRRRPARPRTTDDPRPPVRGRAGRPRDPPPRGAGVAAELDHRP